MNSYMWMLVVRFMLFVVKSQNKILPHVDYVLQADLEKLLTTL